MPWARSSGLVLGFLVACADVRSAEPTDLDVVSSLGGMLAQARCRCAELLEYYGTEEQCEMTERARWRDRIVALARAGRLAVRDGVDPATCLAHLRSCRAMSHKEAPCTDLFQGKIADGQACVADLECGSGRCEPQSSLCGGRLGRCAPAALEGERCSRDSECVAGLVCQPEGCSPPLAAGEACLNGGSTPAQTGCPHDLVCVASAQQLVCGEQRAAGDACGVDRGTQGWRLGYAECSEGLLCSTDTFRCEVPRALSVRRGEGQPCLVSGPLSRVCVQSLVCVEGACEVPRAVGQPCQHDRWCASSYCAQGACRDLVELLRCAQEP